MDYCPLCKEIIKIRISQNKNYYHDLCPECKAVLVRKILSLVLAHRANIG